MTNYQSAPVIKHRDWRFLLRDFIAAHRSFHGLSAGHLKMLLMPAASVAWWVLTYRPELLTRGKLDVLVAGASNVECMDGGRWWAYLPWLLGVPGLNSSVTLVGDELVRDVESGELVPTTRMSSTELVREMATPYASWVKSNPPAQLVNGMLGDWKKSGAQLPDVCVLFAPGFESHYETWLTEDDLLPLLRANVPMATFSYSKMDFQGDLHLLAACGLELADATFKVNPWTVAHEMSEFIGSFAGIAWELKTDKPVEAAQADEAALREFQSLMRYIRENFEDGGDSALEQLGSKVLIRRLVQPGEVSDGKDGRVADALYLLPDNTAIVASSRMVGEILDGGHLELFEPPMAVEQALLDTWPQGENVELQRCIWAARLHRDHVAPKRTPPGLEGFVSKLGGMGELPPELQAMLSSIGNRNPERGSQRATPGSESFFNALDRDDFKKAAALAEKDPTLLHAQNEQGKTGLMLLYDEGQLELMDSWLALKPGLNVVDSEGHGLIHDVISKDDVTMLEKLHAAGQDLNLPGGASFMPSAMALTRRAHKCLAYLVEHDADLTTPSLAGISVAAAYSRAGIPAPLIERIKQRLSMG